MGSELLTVVLYGGPGTGKSTLAAQVFAELKIRGVSVECVHEVAKSLTWERRAVALSHQAYINAKQMFHMDRLEGQVDVILMDTSTLLAMIYGTDITPAFEAWLLDDYRRRRPVNILLKRDPNKEYQGSGRNQTYAEALAADGQIEDMLIRYDLPYISLQVNDPGVVEMLATHIEYIL